MLRRAFFMFDSCKTGKIELAKVRLILNTLGYTYDDSELDGLLSAEDTEGMFEWKKGSGRKKKFAINHEEEKMWMKKKISQLFFAIDLALES